MRRAVDTWNNPGEVVTCNWKFLAIDYAVDVLTMHFPRKCFGYPDELRWSVETRKVTEARDNGSYSYFLDAAPRFHKFGPWWPKPPPRASHKQLE